MPQASLNLSQAVPRNGCSASGKMKLLPQNQPFGDLLHLNDDCLELVLRQLPLVDAYAVGTLHERFAAVLSDLWRRQYGGRVDFAAEPQLKVLPAEDLSSLVACLVANATELLNVDARIWRALSGMAAPIRRALRVRRLCFGPEYQQHHHHTDATPQHGQHSTKHRHDRRNHHPDEEGCSLQALGDFRQLAELHICAELLLLSRDAGDLSVLRRLPLREFVCLPTPGLCVAPPPHRTLSPGYLAELPHCRSLRVLQLGLADIASDEGRRLFAETVACVPHLQQLTVFTTPAMTTHGTSVALTRLVEALRSCAAKWSHVVGMQWHCHVTGAFPSLFRHLAGMRSFAWHGHLHVYRHGDGSVEWTSLDSDTISREVYAMIADACPNVRRVDLRWNHYATEELVAKVRQLLQQRAVRDVSKFGEEVNLRHGFDDEDDWHDRRELREKGFIAFEFA